MDMRHDFKVKPRAISRPRGRFWQPETVAIVAIFAIAWALVALHFAFDIVPW